MACIYYEFKSCFIGGDYWCKKKDCRVDDDTYYRYCRDYSYDECPIYKERSSTGGCFLTTVICKLLGMNDNNVVLDNLRMFRDDVLQKEEKYYDILKDYDMIGPMIVDCILHDKDKNEMAEGLYKNCILKINDEVINKEYDKAVEHYYLMTLGLINYYGLKHDYNLMKYNVYENIEFIPEMAGHGVKRIKSK